MRKTRSRLRLRILQGYDDGHVIAAAVYSKLPPWPPLLIHTTMSSVAHAVAGAAGGILSMTLT
jgi:hypothetical protein